MGPHDRSRSARVSRSSAGKPSRVHDTLTWRRALCRRSDVGRPFGPSAHVPRDAFRRRHLAGETPSWPAVGRSRRPPSTAFWTRCATRPSRCQENHSHRGTARSQLQGFAPSTSPSRPTAVSGDERSFLPWALFPLQGTSSFRSRELRRPRGRPAPQRAGYARHRHSPPKSREAASCSRPPRPNHRAEAPWHSGVERHNFQRSHSPPVISRRRHDPETTACTSDDVQALCRHPGPRPPPPTPTTPSTPPKRPACDAPRH